MGQMKLRVNELLKARELRDGRRHGPDEVAQTMGIAPDVFRSLAANRAEEVRLSDLARLCDYFHCTAGELLHYDGHQHQAVEDEVDSRDIVARWERTFGADERVPEA